MLSLRPLLVAVLAASCAGPDTPTHVAASTSTSTNATGEPTTTEEPPTRPAPPPFVLPEGCGDGVIVVGQYDCFVPHPLNSLLEAAWPEYPNDKIDSYRYAGYDIEGDGKDEILVTRNGGEMVVIRYEDGQLVLEDSVPNNNSLYGDRAQPQTRWDWTGDGRADFTRLGRYGLVAARANLDGKGLGSEQAISQSSC